MKATPYETTLNGDAPTLPRHSRMRAVALTNVPLGSCVHRIDDDRRVPYVLRYRSYTRCTLQSVHSSRHTIDVSPAIIVDIIDTPARAPRITLDDHGKPKRTRKPTTKRGSKRVKLFGEHSMSSTIRAIGKRGRNVDDVDAVHVAVGDRLDIDADGAAMPSRTTIVIQLNAGALGQRGKAAELSESQWQWLDNAIAEAKRDIAARA